MLAKKIRNPPNKTTSRDIMNPNLLILLGSTKGLWREKRSKVMILTTFNYK
jgi:hypothetical protein